MKSITFGAVLFAVIVSGCATTEKREWVGLGGGKADGTIILGIDLPAKFGVTEPSAIWEFQQANEEADRQCKYYGYSGAKLFEEKLPVQEICSRMPGGISPCGEKAYRITYQCLGKTKIQACFDALVDSNMVDPIRGKIALSSANNQEFSMLTDSSIPNPQEKQAILLWGNGRDQCFALQRSENAAKSVNPQIMAVLDSYTSSQQNILAQLYMEKITYGDFAAKRQAIATTTNEALAGIQSELQRQSGEARDRARQIAVQAEQNAIAAISSINQNMLIQQQNTILQRQLNQNSMRINVPQRLQTTCNFVGSTMFCN